MKQQKKMTQKQEYIAMATEKYLRLLCKKCEFEIFPIYIYFKNIANGFNAKSILYNTGEITVTYDKKYVSTKTDIELDRTACHEVCHCIMFNNMSNFKNRLADAENEEEFLHGYFWKKLMEKAEVDPSYYHLEALI